MRATTMCQRLQVPRARAHSSIECVQVPKMYPKSIIGSFHSVLHAYNGSGKCVYVQCTLTDFIYIYLSRYTFGTS